MTFQEIQDRIKQLQFEAEQAAGAYNMKMGQLNEARNTLNFMEKQRDEALAAANAENLDHPPEANDSEPLEGEIANG